MIQPDIQTPYFPQRIKISREKLDHPDDRPSPTMQAYIQEVAQKYCCDLAEHKSDLTLDLPDGNARLIISRIDQDLILVTRMVPENGHWWEDPSLLFLDTTIGWVPFEVLYAPDLWEAYAAVMAADSTNQILDEFSQPILVNFTEYIAKQLIAEDWLTQGQLVNQEQKENDMLANSVLMQEFVTNLIQTYPTQKIESGVYLELTMGQSGWLVIREEEPQTLYSVGFMREDLNGIPQVDPELTFYVENKTRWCPLTIHRYWEGDAVAADFDLETKEITVHDAAGQEQLAAYADVLAQHWQREGWALFARPVLPSGETDDIEDVPF